jgi:hypothetical protein
MAAVRKPRMGSMEHGSIGSMGWRIAWDGSIIVFLELF